VRTLSLIIAAGIITLLAKPALADQGVILAVPSGCDYFAAESPKGLVVLEWYGGHQPSADEKIVGDFDQYGFHDIYVLPAGSQMRVWVEDYLLSRDRAAAILAEKFHLLGR